MSISTKRANLIYVLPFDFEIEQICWKYKMQHMQAMSAEPSDSICKQYEKCFKMHWVNHGWVSSTPFGLPFRPPVQFQIKGPFIICKWLVKRDFDIISASFQNWYVLHISLLLYVLKWDECLSFNCHLSYRFRYQFSCF